VKSTIKNNKPKAEKLMNIKKSLFKHVTKDRYWDNQAPLFMASTTEFRQTLFAIGNLLPRRMSTPAVEILADNTNTLEEVEEESNEMRLYREYYMSTSSGLLATGLMKNK